MEVMDSPLNRAHHYGRKADQLMAKEKYEEAILCHSEAAELLKEALSMTASEQVRLSLELQRDWHLHQQRLIQMSCEQAKLKGKLPVSPITQDVLHSPPIGWKAAKDDRTRLEEQSTAIADLWKLLAVLLLENKSLMEEQKQLKEENERLRREHDHHSPPASPDQPSSLSVRLLDVTPDLQHELQQLLEMANHN